MTQQQRALVQALEQVPVQEPEPEPLLGLEQVA